MIYEYEHRAREMRKKWHKVPDLYYYFLIMIMDVGLKGYF